MKLYLKTASETDGCDAQQGLNLVVHNNDWLFKENIKNRRPCDNRPKCQKYDFARHFFH